MSAEPSYKELVEKVKRLENESLEFHKIKEELFRIKRAIETTGDAIGVTDFKGGPIFHNQALTNLFEYTAQELKEAGGPTLLYGSQKVAKEVFEAIMGGKSWNGDIEMVSRSGRKFPVALRADAIVDDVGKVIGVIGVHRDITELKQAEELIHNLSRQLLTSQESERQKISFELHDSVAQDLSSVRITCKMLLKDNSLTPRFRKQISAMSRNLHETLKNVRGLSYELRPPGLEELGLTQVLYQLCEDFSEKTGVRVKFLSAGMDNVRLKYAANINMYRLLQESLNNVRKHADAGNVNIKLISSYPNIILRIEDDGIGFNIEKRLTEAYKEKRMGIRSMKERVGLLQGKMHLESIPGKGTKIVIEIAHEDNNKTPGLRVVKS